jgi:hypothetical protein
MIKVICHTAGYFNDPTEEVKRLRRIMMGHQFDTPDCPHCKGVNWLTVEIEIDDTPDDYPTYEIVREETSEELRARNAGFYDAYENGVDSKPYGD